MIGLSPALDLKGPSMLCYAGQTVDHVLSPASKNLKKASLFSSFMN